MLRGALIVRKVSHCWKNEDGAGAFTSVIRALARNGGDQSLVNGLSGAPGLPVPLESLPHSYASAYQLPLESKVK